LAKANDWQYTVSATQTPNPNPWLVVTTQPVNGAATHLICWEGADMVEHKVRLTKSCQLGGAAAGNQQTALRQQHEPGHQDNCDIQTVNVFKVL